MKKQIEANDIQPETINIKPKPYEFFQNFFKNESNYIIKTLDENKELLSAKSPNNSNLLHWACSYVNKEVVKYLIEEQGFGKRVNELNELNELNESFQTPLHFVFNKVDNDTSRLELIKYLVGKNADVNLKDNNGNTPLHLACLNNADIEIIKYLFENGSDLNSKDNNGNTPLHLACFYNADIETIKYLVEKSSPSNIKSAICKLWGAGALEKFNDTKIFEEKFNSKEIFKPFKFSPESQSSKFWESVKYEKSLEGVSDKIKEELELKFGTLFKHSFFQTFIDYAEKNGCQIVFWHKDYSSKPTLHGSFNKSTKNISIFIDPQNMDFTNITVTILHELKHFYNDHKFKHNGKPYGLEDIKSKELWDKMVNKHVIPSKGVFHDICDNYGENDYTAELPAWIFGKLVEEILNNNSDWMTRNFDLVRAVWYNILKGLNNDLTLSDLVGKKLLTEMVSDEIFRNTINFETIKHLVENKADLSSKNHYGNTPLHLACDKKVNFEIIKHLVENKADLSSKNHCGETPLHLACGKNAKIENIKYLVEMKADVNSQDFFGNTPLQIAQSSQDTYNYQQTLEILLTGSTEDTRGDIN